MKTLITTGWNFMRMLRLSLGVVALFFAFLNQDTLLGFAGGFLLLTAVLNIGCCGVSTCTAKSCSPKVKPPIKNQNI